MILIKTYPEQAVWSCPTYYKHKKIIEIFQFIKYIRNNNSEIKAGIGKLI
jgi:hypothetical protein